MLCCKIAAIEITGTKIFGKRKADYVVFLWLSTNYKIRYLTFLSTKEILRKKGKKKKYEIKAHIDFPEKTITSKNDIGKVVWKNKIKSKEFLNEWLNK